MKTREQIYQKEWAIRNKDRLKKYKADRYQKYKDRDRKYRAKWYQENKKKVSARHRLWRINNLEKDRANKKRYRLENIEKTRKQARAHYERNRESIISKSKAYNRTPGRRFILVQWHATRRGLSFGITLEQFVVLLNSPCYYCGECKIERGLDRVDNSVGYEFHNVASCCPQCNRAKLDHTKESFISMCHRVAQRHPL